MALPTAAELTGVSTTNAQQKTYLQGLRDFIANVFGTTETKTAVRSTLGVGDAVDRQGFRLTLTSGVPVTTSDVTSGSTLYACPYKGNEIALYSSSVWAVYESAQFSIALSGLTSGRPYDVFCYVSGSTPTLEVLAWASDTTRATALTYQDGVLVKSGDATRRYLGTFYTTSATTTADSEANRYLWNYYHRVRRSTKVFEATNSWTYSTTTWRQANANTANQLNFVVGVAEDTVTARVAALVTNSTATERAVITAIGVDSVGSPVGSLPGQMGVTSVSATSLISHYSGVPGIGRHYLSWLEYGGGTDTQTWYGDNGGALQQTGILGEVFA
jgi:hypothetical protein